MTRDTLAAAFSAVSGEGGSIATRVLRATLTPAELGFWLATRAYHAAYSRRWLPRYAVAVPVISVGNLTVGGSGKTPVAAWIARRLLETGQHVAILHGGYAEDEPALHRLWNPAIPVFAGNDRLRAAGEAIAGGAKVLVLDDAFQHRRIERDLDIVLIAAERWQARPRLLPRGRWREPPEHLSRAGAIGVTARTVNDSRALTVLAEATRFAPGAIGFVLRLAPAGWSRLTEAGLGPEAAPPVGIALGVAAIAEPELFVANARAAGARIERCRFYADHHVYSEVDWRRLVREAGDSAIVTTEKDAVKLQRYAGGAAVFVLRQRVVAIVGENTLWNRIGELLTG
ncbi:MAG: tetraacyldisaccharide 4'-kinase [Longimicrobiales bacterium]